MSEPIVEELDRDECLRLLATQVVGRLAVAEPGAAPHLLPVDCFDPDGRTGWSVTIRGQAYEASDREMEIEDIHLAAFVERQNSRWVRLVPESVTGRRIVRPSSTAEKHGASGD